MQNNNLIEKESQGFFSKIRAWFKKIFVKSDIQTVKKDVDSLEFSKQDDIQDEQIYQEYNQNDNLKYNFSTATISKQKLEKIRLDLDNGKIGIDELYQLSNDEIEELRRIYDSQIEDTVFKLNELEVNINNYERRISKIQGQN